MSASSSPSQPLSAGGEDAISAAEVDASCRAPVLLLFAAAIAWLFIGSILQMIATLKFHMPTLLAECPAMTYGRVHPAHLNALVYGFAAQAGLGVILWLTAHLSRARLAMGPLALAGILTWNLGMALGTLGIFYGEGTGYEWLEMPRYALAMLFFGYVLIAIGPLVTVHLRSEREMYVSQWFVIAALFWFPWIFSTAALTLVVKPVRGVLQTGIDFWYANNLLTVWFGLIGLAAIFYFVPKGAKRPFHSHYIGLFIFWLLILFGSTGGIPPGTPVPSWMWALSTMGALLMIVPALSVAVSVKGTMGGDYSILRVSRPFKFFLFAAAAYIIAELSGAANSVMRVNEVTEFTWYVPAQYQVYIYGFFAMAMFGAIYYIVPRLVLAEFPMQGAICGQFLLSGLGIVVYALPLAIGGIVEGMKWNNPANGFQDVSQSALMFLRVSTIGDLLMFLGALVLLLNFAGLLVRLAKLSAMAAWESNTKTVEVAR